MNHLEGSSLEQDYISTSSKEDWEKDLMTPSTSQPTILIACSSDRGLCGAIHSSISKTIKHLMLESNSLRSSAASSIVILGEKAKAQISRVLASSISMHFNGIGKTVPSMSEAISILERILTDATAREANLTLICNRFISVIAFETTAVPLITNQQLMEAPKLSVYESSDEELVNFAEYLRIVRFYQALAEGHVAELSAKRTAMENATKNTVEMTETLTMKYNRTRQTVITNELVDIITGASAL